MNPLSIIATIIFISFLLIIFILLIGWMILITDHDNLKTDYDDAVEKLNKNTFNHTPDENAQYIASCVNGCKGIVDPETTVPELLVAPNEALVKSQDEYQTVRSIYASSWFRAALAKAKGETL